MSKGQSKPETVSVRIREDDYAEIVLIAKRYGVKNVDVVQKLVDAWTMIDEEDQDMVFTGDMPPEEDPPVIYKSEPGEGFRVVYKKTPPPE